MYGLSKDLDLSFFVGKRLDTVTFAEFVIHFNFDDKVWITLESEFQHQLDQDVKHDHVGVVQSVPVTHSTLMRLVGHSVVSAAAEVGGTLALVFDDGQVLRCFELDVPYESYQFSDGTDDYVV